MMKRLLLILFLFPYFVFSQIQFKTVNSTVLKEKRQVKIQLPRGYDNNTEKAYPVIFVLDGDYLFEPVAGNVDYYSYWDEIPEAIVVGVNQAGMRKEDVMYGPENYLPENKSADFFQFVGGELLPLIDKNYRTLPFDIIVGLDLTANFINYYLFKKDPLFAGYVNLSPDFAPKMHSRIKSALSHPEMNVWYYLATGSEDIEGIKEDVSGFNEQLKNISSENVHYSYDNFNNATHYSLVGNAIPKALEAIFSPYRSIAKPDIDKLVKEEKSPCEYLEQKYENIEELYGIKMKIRIQDFITIASAIEKTQKWEDFKDLSKLAEDNWPRKMLEYYFEGRYYEETGKPERAIKKYQKAYGMVEVPGLSSDMVLERMNKLKADFEN